MPRRGARRLRFIDDEAEEEPPTPPPKKRQKKTTLASKFDSEIEKYHNERRKPAEIAEMIRDTHGLTEKQMSRKHVNSRVSWLKKNGRIKTLPVNDPEDLEAQDAIEVESAPTCKLVSQWVAFYFAQSMSLKY